MSAFGTWRVLESQEHLEMTFWGLGTSCWALWEVLGEHFGFLWAPFGSLGVTLWFQVALGGDSGGFCEPFGLHVESFWMLLGIIWELWGRLLVIHCSLLAEKCGIVEMHENLHQMHVFHRF